MTQAPAYRIRAYRPGDESAILATFNRVFARVDPTFQPRTLEALPSAARGYRDRLQELAGVPIAMVSTGADRDETILRHDPFA